MNVTLLNFMEFIEQLELAAPFWFSLGFVFLILIAFMLREIGTWLVKNNDIKSDLLDLREQIFALERKLDLIHELKKAPEPEVQTEVIDKTLKSEKPTNFPLSH